MTNVISTQTFYHHNIHYLEPVDVLLSIATAGLTACNLISELVNNDIKWTLLFQRLIEINLWQQYDKQCD